MVGLHGQLQPVGNANYNAAPQVTERPARAIDQVVSVTPMPRRALPSARFTVAATGGARATRSPSASGVLNVAHLHHDQWHGHLHGQLQRPARPTTTRAAGHRVDQREQFDQTIDVATMRRSAAFGSSFHGRRDRRHPATWSPSQLGACSIGATFTMTSGTGTCTVNYNQAGNANYNAAPQVTESTSAGKASTSTALSSSANPSRVRPACDVHRDRFERRWHANRDASSSRSAASTSAHPSHSVPRTTPSSTTLAVGSRSITALYGGTTNFATSTGSLTQSVTKASVTVTVTSNHNPVKKGTSITFTVTVGTVRALDEDARRQGQAVPERHSGRQRGSR